jgi:hypothetical protein
MQSVSRSCFTKHVITKRWREESISSKKQSKKKLPAATLFLAWPAEIRAAALWTTYVGGGCMILKHVSTKAKVDCSTFSTLSVLISCSKNYGLILIYFCLRVSAFLSFSLHIFFSRVVHLLSRLSSLITDRKQKRASQQRGRKKKKLFSM